MAGGWTRPLTIPTGTGIKFMRLTGSINNTTFMVVEGAQSATYRPYGEYTVSITSEAVSDAIKETIKSGEALDLNILMPFSLNHINLAIPSEFTAINSTVSPTDGKVYANTNYQVIFQ